jgi:hypothetical protein
MLITLQNQQIEIEGYISDAGNLCFKFDPYDVIEIDGKSVLIIDKNNIYNFYSGIVNLVEEAQGENNG